MEHATDGVWRTLLAAAREVAARHFAQQFSDGVFEMLRPCAGNTNIAVWKMHRDEALNPSEAAATLLERLAKAEAEARQPDNCMSEMN